MSLRNTIGSADLEAKDFAFAQNTMGGHGGRRQVASRKEERSAALTIQLSRNREAAIKPLQNTTDIFHQFLGVSLKNIFAFF